METGALNNLWRYIETLPLTAQNRQWLVDKLLSSNKGEIEDGLSVLRDRLQILSKLGEDWDDEGALPISPAVIANAQTLLDSAISQDLAHWNLFPAINGTLTFQHEKLDAMLSLGKEDYSFVFAAGGRIVKAVDNAPFSTKEILELMRLAKEKQYA